MEQILLYHNKNISKGIKSNYFDKNSLIGKRKVKLNSSQDDILRVVLHSIIQIMKKRI